MTSETARDEPQYGSNTVGRERARRGMNLVPYLVGEIVPVEKDGIKFGGVPTGATLTRKGAIGLFPGHIVGRGEKAR